MILGLQRGKVKLVEYSPKWKELFDVEKIAIIEMLGEEAISVEHVGSTSIPGMIAKPILDVMVAVDSIDDYEHFTPLLKKLGYQFMRDNRDNQEHVLYVKGGEEKRTHYLKFTNQDSRFWKEHVLFRDYLVSHPERAIEYKELKQDLLEKFKEEREKYTVGNEQFILEILRLAEE